MKKTLKKQLFSSPLFLALLLFLPLGVFVSYAAYIRSQFFVLLGITILFILGLLVFFHRKITMMYAEYDIRRQDFSEQANLLESDIEKERQGARALRQKMVDYGKLKDIAEKLNATFSLEETSQVLSNEVSQMFGQKDTTVILYLFHSRTGELGLSASQKGQMQVNLKAKRGDLYDQWVVKNMQVLLIEDVKNDFRFDDGKIHTEDSRTIRSLMSVPMMIGNKAIGILRLDSPKSNYFYPENLRLLHTIADLGAVAIENAQLYEKIEDLAIRDGLTGLLLRRHFLERLDHEINRARRQKTQLSFLMIDLDFFKKYNDQQGHIAGDIVLKTLSMILSDICSQPGDMVCRYGGEEFAVLLPDRFKQEAGRFAEALRKKVEDQAIILRRQKTHITVSIGVAAFPDDADLKDDLIEKADGALYQAKRKGRNQVCMA